jgi:hypothetical protein
MFLGTPWSYLKLKRNLQKHDFDSWGPGLFIPATGTAWAPGRRPLDLALLLGAPRFFRLVTQKQSLLCSLPLLNLKLSGFVVSLSASFLRHSS